MATTPSTKAGIIAAGYGGYSSWNDEASIVADFNATGGKGKETQGTNMSTDMSVPNSQDGMPSYLAKFQEQALNSLSDLKPAEAPTFEELKNNLTPTGPKPETLNRVAERQALVTSLGVTDLEKELNTIKTQETQITDELRALTGTEEGKPVAMNVISGRITEEQRVAQQRLDAVIRQKNSVIGELNTKYNVINTYMTDIGLDYQDAVQAYNADFEKNYKVQSMITDMRNTEFSQTLQKIGAVTDTVMEAAKFEQQIKQNNIDNARANLTTMTNAITAGNVNYESLSADQKLQIQKLEVQSGIPVGTMANFKQVVDPKANVMFTTSNEGVTQIGYFNPATGQVEVKTYGTSTGSGKKPVYSSSEEVVIASDALAEVDTNGDQMVSLPEYEQARKIVYSKISDPAKAQSALDTASNAYQKWNW